MDHPTGKKPKKVILIGLGPSKSEYMNIMASDSLGINHDEVWGINGAGNVIKVDCSFAMDDYLICPDRTPTFAKFFEEADHPVFTSTPRTPNAIAYPLRVCILRCGLCCINRRRRTYYIWMRLHIRRHGNKAPTTNRNNSTVFSVHDVLARPLRS